MCLGRWGGGGGEVGLEVYLAPWGVGGGRKYISITRSGNVRIMSSEFGWFSAIKDMFLMILKFDKRVGS